MHLGTILQGHKSDSTINQNAEHLDQSTDFNKHKGCISKVHTIKPTNMHKNITLTAYKSKWVQTTEFPE